MSESTLEEQMELDGWHEALADAIAEALPELPEGYWYDIKTQTFVDDWNLTVLVGAKRALIDDTNEPAAGHVPISGLDDWWAEFFIWSDDAS